MVEHIATWPKGLAPRIGPMVLAHSTRREGVHSSGAGEPWARDVGPWSPDGAREGRTRRHYAE
jgi:hypothetical protein